MEGAAVEAEVVGQAEEDVRRFGRRAGEHAGGQQGGERERHCSWLLPKHCERDFLKCITMWDHDVDNC